MGAELSTLAKLWARKEWDPKQDTLTLLASETDAGVWCAAMARAMLLEWGVPAGNITPQVVEQLKELPGSPEDAAINLAKAVMQANISYRKNVIVITGGFKSGIPVLTVVALVYGMRLVYLFEDAPDVQWIDLREPGNAPSPWKKIPPILQEFFDKITPKKPSGSGALSDFVRLVIDTWLEKNSPPHGLGQ